MNYHHFYILDGHTPVPVTSAVEWGLWFEDINNRRVAEDKIGDVWVSTVFLGIDHNWGDGPPLLFETMAFDADHHDLAQERYATWDDAERGHTAMLKTMAELIELQRMSDPAPPLRQAPSN